MGRTRGGAGRQIDASGRRDARDGRSRRGRGPGRRRSGGDRDGRGTTTGRAVGGFGFLSRGGFGASGRGGWGEMGTETHPHAANSAPRVNVTSAKPSMKDNSGAAPSRADIAGSGEHARGTRLGRMRLTGSHPRSSTADDKTSASGDPPACPTDLRFALVKNIDTGYPYAENIFRSLISFAPVNEVFFFSRRGGARRRGGTTARAWWGCERGPPLERRQRWVRVWISTRGSRRYVVVASASRGARPASLARL